MNTMINKYIFNKIFVGAAFVLLFFIQVFPPMWANDVTSLRHFFISILISVGGTFAFITLIRKKQHCINPFSFPVMKVWLGLIAWMLLSFLWALNRVESLVVANRWILIIMLAFLLIVFLTDRANTLHFIIYSAMAVALVNVIVCISSYFYLNCADYPHKIPMINGGYGNKNIFAVCMMFKLPFLYYALFRYKRVFKVISSILIVAICFCLPIISTRSAFICLGLNILILFTYSIFYMLRFKKKHYLLKSVLIFVLLIGGFVLGSYFVTYRYAHGNQKQKNEFAVSQRIKETGTGKSSKVRLQNWKNTITIAREKPLHGWGVGNHKIVIMKVETPQKNNFVVSDHAHNDFLEMYSELGFLGMLIYLSLYITMFIVGIRIIFYKKTKEPYRLISLVSLMLLLTYMNDAMFNFPNERATCQIYLALSVGMMGMCYFKYKEIKQQSNKYLKKTKGLNFISLGLFMIISLPVLAVETTHFYSSSLQYQRIICYNTKNKKRIAPEYWELTFPSIPNIDESTRPIAVSLGNMYAQMGDYRSAINVVKHDNSNPYLAIKEYSLAIWYSNLGMKDSALFFADSCLRMKPRSFAAVRIKLNLYRRDKEEVKAMQVLDEYIKEHPLNYLPWVEKINTFINQEDYLQAQKTIEQAKEYLPKERAILKKEHIVDSLLNTK